MAKGTRIKDLNEHIKAVEEKMQFLTTKYNQVLETKKQQFEVDYNKKLGVLVQQLDEIQKEGHQRYEARQIEAVRRHEQLLKLFTSQPPTVKPITNSPVQFKQNKHTYDHHPSSSTQAPLKEDRGKGILPNPQMGHEGNPVYQGPRNPYYIPHPKLDYPTFEGEEPREWLSKSEQYFKFYQILEEQWVEVASFHFSGKARRWKEGYLLDKPDIRWEELSEAICRRFDGASMK